MNALFFSRLGRYAHMIVAGLNTEHIYVEMFHDIPSAHRIMGDSAQVYIFQGDVSAEHCALIQLIRELKPIHVIVYLDPPLNTSLESSDLVFYTPFSYPSIAFEIQRLLLRRRSVLSPRDLKVGDVCLNLYEHTCTYGNLHIRLRHREFALLQYFLMNRDRVLSRTELLEAVWDRNISVSSNTVDVHVSRLRKRLQECRAHAFLQTIACVGYQWVSAVT